MKDRKNLIYISEISRSQKKQPVWRQYKALYEDNIIHKSEMNVRPSFLYFFRTRVVLNIHVDSTSSLLTNS